MFWLLLILLSLSRGIDTVHAFSHFILNKKLETIIANGGKEPSNNQPDLNHLRESTDDFFHEGVEGAIELCLLGGLGVCFSKKKNSPSRSNLMQAGDQF